MKNLLTKKSILIATIFCTIIFAIIFSPAYSTPFECMDGAGADAYSRGYYHQWNWLESRWPEYGCDKIIEFSHITQDYFNEAGPENFMCNNAGKNDASWYFIRKKIELCSPDRDYDNDADVPVLE